MPSFRNILGLAVAVLIGLALPFLFGGGPAMARPEANRDGGAWDAASKGKSSFRELGPDFSVDVAMEKVEGAKVVLLNEELARELGLSADSIADLEQKILGSFALMVSENAESPRHMFSTRYLDVRREDLEKFGNPQGDGRVVWAGEIALRRPDGSFVYVDVSLKGVGRTPLARRAKLDSRGMLLNEAYADGLQGMDEAVKSFITSNALAENGIGDSRDLAVIELPITKNSKVTNREEKAAITVRVGGQTRLAHLRYFENDPENFKKIFEYVVRRDLGLAPTESVTTAHIEKHLDRFVDSVAELAAQFEDLQFIHGSPTLGNMTTRGTPIDFGTSFALDANHQRMPIFKGRLLAGGQSESIRHYVMLYYQTILGSSYPWRSGHKEIAPRLLDEARAKAHFEERYQITKDTLWLNRLGLSAEDIATLPKELKAELLAVGKDVEKILGTEKKEVGRNSFVPQAFSSRDITRHSLRIEQLPPAEQDEAWEKVFLTEKNWGTLTPENLRPPEGLDARPSRIPAFLRKFWRGNRAPVDEAAAVYYRIFARYKRAIASLNVHLKEKGLDPAPRIARAEAIGAKERAARGEETSMRRLLEHIRRGEPGTNFSSFTAEALAAIEELVDRREAPTVLPLTRPHSLKKCVDAYARFR